METPTPPSSSTPIPPTPNTPSTPTNSSPPPKPEVPDMITILLWFNLGTVIIGILLTFILIRLAPLILIAWPFYRIVLPLLAVINLVFFTRYLLKNKPKVLFRFLSIGVIVLSIGYLYFLISSSIEGEARDKRQTTPLTREEAVALINDCEVRSISRGLSEKDHIHLSLKDYSEWERVALDSDFSALNEAATTASSRCGEISVRDRRENYHPVYLTIDEASKLLNGCKVVGFYYTANGNIPQILQSDGAIQGTPTGIVLVYKEKPIRIHIEDTMIEILVPIARAAQKQCPHLQFWHDGSYEHKDADGNWR